MKNILIAIVLGFSMALGGCASTGGVPTQTQADIEALIAQVQSYTRTACGFVPTAASIAAILSGGNPGVIAATSIAQAICAAVAPPLMAGRVFTAKSVKGWQVTPGAVNGVRVDGVRSR